MATFPGSPANPGSPSNALAQMLLFALLMQRLGGSSGQKKPDATGALAKKGGQALKKVLGLGSAGAAGGTAAASGIGAGSSAAIAPVATELGIAAPSLAIPSAAPLIPSAVPGAAAAGSSAGAGAGTAAAGSIAAPLVAALAVATGHLWTPSVARAGEKFSQNVLGLGNNENFIPRSKEEILSAPGVRNALPGIDRLDSQSQDDLVRTLFEGPGFVSSGLFKGERTGKGALPQLGVRRTAQKDLQDDNPVKRRDARIAADLFEQPFYEQIGAQRGTALRDKGSIRDEIDFANKLFDIQGRGSSVPSFDELKAQSAQRWRTLLPKAKDSYIDEVSSLEATKERGRLLSTGPSFSPPSSGRGMEKPINIVPDDRLVGSFGGNADISNTGFFPGRPIAGLPIDVNQIKNFPDTLFKSQRPVGFDEVSPGVYRRRT